VYIFGYSGHSYVIIEALLDLGHVIHGYFDIKEATKNPYKLKYVGHENMPDLADIIGDCYVFPSVGDALIRMKLISIFRENNFNEFALIDPTARISPTASIGLSSFVGKGSIINALAQVGSGCIVNTNAILEHECVIGEYVHIAPGAILCGGVVLGKNVMIGANSVVRQGVSICSNVMIGAGSVVVKDIENEGTYFGNPVKLK